MKQKPTKYTVAVLIKELKKLPPAMEVMPFVGMGLFERHSKEEYDELRTRGDGGRVGPKMQLWDVYPRGESREGTRIFSLAGRSERPRKMIRILGVG